jgi:4-hydroxy-2-oxoheptanedioate aldolase
MKKRINKVIDLFEQGQPVYCVQALDLNYQGGLDLANTWADWIRVRMEHDMFDFPGLEAFMKGLMDGGPTRSGHLLPMVTVELPVGGYSEAVIRANAWMMQIVLGLGCHGILLCHAENPESVKAFVESCRYPFYKNGVGEGLDIGQRGAGGEFSASKIWGISVSDYQRRADVWPLNPNGELALGVKIETKQAVARAEEIVRVPGLCFAEWGPADMTASFGYIGRTFKPYPDDVYKARNLVMSASKNAGLYFLHAAYEDDVIDILKEGVMMCDPHSEPLEKVAEIGRKYTSSKKQF